MVRELSLIGIASVTLAFKGMTRVQLRNFVEALTSVKPPAAFGHAELVQLASILFHARVDDACHATLMTADRDTVRVLASMLGVPTVGADKDTLCSALTERMEPAAKLKLVHGKNRRVETFLKNVLRMRRGDSDDYPHVVDVLWTTVKLVSRALETVIVASDHTAVSNDVARACLSDPRSCIVALVSLQSAVCGRDAAACTSIKDATCGLMVALTGGALGAIAGAGDILGPLGAAVGAACGDVDVRLTEAERRTIRADFAVARGIVGAESVVARAIEATVRTFD
jgi:hypothetical protein